jgi:hypothetical protein
MFIDLTFLLNFPKLNIRQVYSFLIVFFSETNKALSLPSSRSIHSQAVFPTIWAPTSSPPFTQSGIVPHCFVFLKQFHKRSFGLIPSYFDDSTNPIHNCSSLFHYFETINSLYPPNWP